MYKVKILPLIRHSVYFSSRISALNVVHHNHMQFLSATHSLSRDLRSALAVSSNRQSYITWKEPDWLGQNILPPNEAVRFTE